MLIICAFNVGCRLAWFLNEVCMAKTISFIGSFRKPEHYAIVQRGVSLFRKNGINVNSPKGSSVSGSIQDFVLFETDPKELSASDIQMITLDKIIKSDVVYVCNLDGYVGRTTCYEIGFCLSRNIPLYFLEKPTDLPITVVPEHIVSMEEMLNIALQNLETKENCICDDRRAAWAKNQIWLTPSETATPADKRIVICGSMQFYNEMRECQTILRKSGIDAIIPKDEGSLPDNISDEDFRLFKKRVSSAYLKKIRDKETSAVLVYNAQKRGIENYIGANTFVELAMAFAWNRHIYLMNEIYTPYADELEAWDAICLHGRLENLIELWDKGDVEKKTDLFTQMSIDDYLEGPNA